MPFQSSLFWNNATFSGSIKKTASQSTWEASLSNHCFTFIPSSAIIYNWSTCSKYYCSKNVINTRGYSEVRKELLASTVHKKNFNALQSSFVRFNRLVFSRSKANLAIFLVYICPLKLKPNLLCFSCSSDTVERFLESLLVEKSHQNIVAEIL